LRLAINILATYSLTPGYTMPANSNCSDICPSINYIAYLQAV